MKNINVNTNCLDSLLEEKNTNNKEIDDKICFLGMGFECAAIPIDVVALFLSGMKARKYSILLVDEFYRFNHVAEDEIRLGLKKTTHALDALSLVYDFKPELIISSDFMHSQEYRKVLQNIEERIIEKGLEKEILQTVPEKHRNSPKPIQYSLNEIACVEFLRLTKQIEVKLGPSTERKYDKIMVDLEFNLDFSYLADAYALGTKEPESVIHYLPSHRGKTNGQRIFLDRPIRNAEIKVTFGPERALIYFLTLASASGQILGKNYLMQDEIESLNLRALKKTSKMLVVENILKPYKEVVKDDCY